MTDLARCPCGKVPETLSTNSNDHSRWTTVSGECCRRWHFEMTPQEADDLDSLIDHPRKYMQKAAAIWNAAPRGEAQ